jgi:hypothetical protein
MGFLDVLFGIAEAGLREVDAKKTGGKVFGAVDSGMNKAIGNYNTKLKNIDSYKRTLNNRSDRELAEICKNSNNNAMQRVAASQILKERGAIK